MSADLTACVAPLHIQKDYSKGTIDASEHQPLSTAIQENPSSRNGQLTPPLTPHDTEASFEKPADFQSYLRAFYPYHPSDEEGSTTQILSLDTGDLILVHSVHTNGWADGTLLASGARGWLPTNYCEGYDNEPISALLRSLTMFWDLVRSSSGTTMRAFQHSDYVKGLVAGVRCLLVSFGPCIRRDHY